jgi:Ca2+/Na+ antiporter
MCTWADFWADFSLNSIDSSYNLVTSESELVTSGIVGEIVLFLLCFKLVVTLADEYMAPAIESVSLRRGATSEAIVHVVRGAFTTLPETGLAFVSILKGSDVHDHSIATCAMLGSGWISLLLIPGLSRTKYISSFLFRDISLYLTLVVLLFIYSQSGSAGHIGGSLLLAVFGIYFVTLLVTQDIERNLRRELRSRNLMAQLFPLQSVLEQHADLEKLPIELATSRFGVNRDYVPLQDLAGQESKDESNTSIGDALLLEECEFTYSTDSHSQSNVFTKLLSTVCIRSLPGTESERLCIPSLLNAFVLLLLLSSILSAICDHWISFVASGVPSRFVGPIIVAGFSKIPEILESSTRRDQISSTFLGSQIFSLGIGLGVPWLINGYIRGSTVLDSRSLMPCLKASFLAIAIVAIYSAFSIKSRTVHFSKSYPLILGYLTVLAFHVWTSFHSQNS